jgi:flagellar P-ring protein precursor FlgI
MNMETKPDSPQYKRYFRIVATVLMALALCASPSEAARIKDLTSIKGVRSNQLVGYGLVVGLDGTGDDKKSIFTTQSIASMLEKMGVTVNPKEIKAENVAAVMVTANLPPFARTGARIDAIVSSIGDAENLQGGNLLMTPLKGADGPQWVGSSKAPRWSGKSLSISTPAPP